MAYGATMSCMARNVFYSFAYAEDHSRAAQVRNIGAIHGNTPLRDNDWEAVKRGGDTAIKKWIEEQLDGTSCTIVLVGASTALRPWVNYEIERSWNRGRGVFGIRIHRLRNFAGQQGVRGANPFDELHFTGGLKRSLAYVVPLHDPLTTDSKEAYGQIARNIEQWVEAAIQLRKNY